MCNPLIRLLAVTLFLVSCHALAGAQISSDRVWTAVDESRLAEGSAERVVIPAAYKTYALNKSVVSAILAAAPEEFSHESRFTQTILTLPMPNGTFGRFRIEHSLIVEPGLLEKYPELGRTYNGRGIDDPTATVRLDFLPTGFHAMVLSTTGTVMVDPYASGDTDNYITYFKRDAPRRTRFSCDFDAQEAIERLFRPTNGDNRELIPDIASPEVISGTQLRTYRLALAATNEYTVAVGANTIAGALAAEVLIMNRVNGVYERDLAIRMVVVANNDLITYAGDNMNCGGMACTSANDPYTNSNGSTMLTENQNNLNAVIMTANYDIGHVFSTGGGGVATLNGPCGANKARGVTGLPNPTGDPFAIDYVAHEMGHQWGANHTFNGAVSNCSGGNRSAASAYEPGSGVTIMAYAGICGNQNLSANSIDTFHVKSLEVIVAYSQTGNGNTCAATTPSGNTPPSVSIVGGPSWNIPKQTPFTLTATGSDVNGDTLSYDWQEYDLGASTTAVPNTDSDGTARPIFRPFLPTPGPSRTFPALTHILSSANVPPSTTGGFLTGELLPAIARTMMFQVVARDNRADGGGINTATATVVVDAASGPFAITAPNTGVTYAGGSSQNITWNVNGTAGAPVDAANVKISYSTDGGNTFPTTLLASTPNDGAQIVTIPVGNTTTARIKVEAVGNIFFDISDTNFTVSGIAAPPRSRADFDGDGKTDLSVFRPSEGNWYLNRSTSGFQVLGWGISTDTLVPGDFDNDAKTDVAVFRPTATAGVPDFYVLNSSTFTATGVEWGTTGDIPVVGDYDGDGKSDFAVYRPSTFTWFVLRSGGGTTITTFGAGSDVPLSADFDGDGKNDIVIYRPGTSQWLGTYSAGGPINVVFGAVGDKVVPADYDGDNKDDFAVYRPSTGTWRVYQSSSGTVVSTSFGISTDIPVPGDYDGDGRDDVAVYRNGTWYVNRSTSGLLVGFFGVASDTAIPAKYIP